MIPSSKIEKYCFEEVEKVLSALENDDLVDTTKSLKTITDMARLYEKSFSSDLKEFITEISENFKAGISKEQIEFFKNKLNLIKQSGLFYKVDDEVSLREYLKHIDGVFSLIKESRIVEAEAYFNKFLRPNYSRYIENLPEEVFLLYWRTKDFFSNVANESLDDLLNYLSSIKYKYKT